MGTLKGFPNPPAKGTGPGQAGGPAWAPRGAALVIVLFALGGAAVGAGCRRSRLVPRGDGAAVLVLEAGASEQEVAVTFAGESEPNDKVPAADVLALVGDPLATGVRGTLASPVTVKGTDVDVFKLVVPGGDPVAAVDGGADAGADAAVARRLVVALSSEGGPDPVLEVLDRAGQVLLTVPGLAAELVSIPNFAVVPGGTYHLRVRASTPRTRARADAGTVRPGYALSVRVLDFELGDEREPNDQAVAATPLAAARTSPEGAGLFGWRRDEDWFRLPLDGLPAGSIFDVELDGVGEVSGSLSVADGQGTRLTTARGRRGERVLLRNLSVSALAPAPAGDAGVASEAFVYLVARAESGRDPDRRYSLRVRADLGREGTEREPNDDAARACPAATGVTQAFLPTGDVDLFRTQPLPEGALDIEVTPPPRVDAKISVLRERDRSVLASAQAAPRGQPELLIGLAATEALLVRVEIARGEGSGDEPYQLRLTPRAAGTVTIDSGTP